MVFSTVLHFPLSFKFWSFGNTSLFLRDWNSLAVLMMEWKTEVGRASGLISTFKVSRAYIFQHYLFRLSTANEDWKFKIPLYTMENQNKQNSEKNCLNPVFLIFPQQYESSSWLLSVIEYHGLLLPRWNSYLVVCCSFSGGGGVVDFSFFWLLLVLLNFLSLYSHTHSSKGHTTFFLSQFLTLMMLFILILFFCEIISDYE